MRTFSSSGNNCQCRISVNSARLSNLEVPSSGIILGDAISVDPQGTLTPAVEQVVLRL
jgi:hypothetical protein